MRDRRLRNPLLVTLLACLALLAVDAGSGEAKEPDDGLDIYFRDADLGELSDQAQETYSESEAGESKLIDRAFPDAPPQIPHTVEDMLPITSDDNECLECHHPDNTLSKADKPLPETHFKRALMAPGEPGEAMVWKVQGYEKAKDVVGGRYNCSMCHTAQATNVATPESSFVQIELTPVK